MAQVGYVISTTALVGVVLTEVSRTSFLIGLQTKLTRAWENGGGGQTIESLDWY